MVNPERQRSFGIPEIRVTNLSILITERSKHNHLRHCSISRWLLPVGHLRTSPALFRQFHALLVFRGRFSDPAFIPEENQYSYYDPQKYYLARIGETTWAIPSPRKARLGGKFYTVWLAETPLSQFTYRVHHTQV